MNDDEGGKRQFVKPHGRADGKTAFVHVGHGLEEMDLAPGKHALADDAVKARTPRSEGVASVNHIDSHEARIVPVARIFRAGIAEPGDEKRRFGHGEPWQPACGLISSPAPWWRAPLLLPWWQAALRPVRRPELRPPAHLRPVPPLPL